VAGLGKGHHANWQGIGERRRQGYGRGTGGTTAQRQANSGCSKWATRVCRPNSATSRNW
jgi:hypothetical protein